MFPESVAPYDSSFLNDLVLDVERDIAYIADAGAGTLVVVDMANQRSVKYQDETTLNDPTYDWIFDGINYGNETLTAQVDGIALTPDMEWLYYCPCQGVQLYRAPTSSLLALLDNPNASVPTELVAMKTTPAGGMAISYDGVMYSGGNADPDLDVWAWKVSLDADEFEETPISDVMWADAFAFDEVGNVLWTRNNLPAFMNNGMDFTQPDNFQIVQYFINSTSYMQPDFA